MAKVFEGVLDGKGKRFGIVVSRFNEAISARLLDGALDCLKRHGTEEDGVEIAWVPGCFEIPLAARRMAEAGSYDGVICLGAVIRGATPHFDIVASQVGRGIARAADKAGLPVVFGVITADSMEQAIERSGGKNGNKGWNAALSALEMASLMAQLRPKKAR